MTAAPVVGFDLDMTLIDSRAGIAATYREVTARTGVFVDADLAVSRLGPPLRHEVAQWFPPDRVDEGVELYRALYPEHAIAPTTLLPGAAEAVADIRARGGRVVVITSKMARLARLHLAHLDLVVDEVAGDRFADGKSAAIIELGVTAYVGDHVADMAAARAAGVPGVGVATGSCPPEQLRAAGAAVVLESLTGLPAWLDHG